MQNKSSKKRRETSVYCMVKALIIVNTLIHYTYLCFCIKMAERIYKLLIIAGKLELGKTFFFTLLSKHVILF